GEQRGLARAAGPEQGDHLAMVDRERHVAQRDDPGVSRAVHLRHGTHFDRWRAGGHAMTSRASTRMARQMPSPLPRMQIRVTAPASQRYMSGVMITLRGK